MLSNAPATDAATLRSGFDREVSIFVMKPEPPPVFTEISVMAAMMTAMIKKEKTLNLNNRFIMSRLSPKQCGR
jgi:hypothetical protein